MLLLLGCQGSLSIGGSDTANAGFDDDAPGGVESLDDNPDTDTGDRPEAEFFDEAVMHTIALTLSDDSMSNLRRDPYEFTEGSIVVDGDSFARVGVRLRGKIGSFRSMRGKPKFKIDFNLYDEEQRLGDYKALALNNEVVDCSYLREPIGYAMIRAIGLPAPRTVFTRVTVNEEDYGLYVAIEYPDNQFVSGHYADNDGNLYDGKYLYYPSSGSYELVDFTSDEQDNFRLEEGTDVALADIMAITSAISAEGTFDERLGGVLDVDAFHRHTAAEQWLGHIDGYTTNTNNYRVYFDTSDGKADLFAYDLDYAFLTAANWGMSWDAPAGALVAACWADAECVARHKEVVSEVISTVDTDALLEQYDAYVAFIEADAESDPRRECGWSDVEYYQSYVRDWVATGSGNLEAFWAAR